MKRITKTAVALCLTLAMTIAILPSAPARALPRTLDRSRVDESYGSTVVMIVGGMQFFGTLVNEALTETQFERLVKEAMTKVGLKSDAEFDALAPMIEKMEKNKEVTPEDKKRILGNVITSLGVVPGGFGAIGSKIGMAASTAGAVYDTMQMDFSDPAGSLLSIAGGLASAGLANKGLKTEVLADAVIDIGDLIFDKIGFDYFSYEHASKLHVRGELFSAASTAISWIQVLAMFASEWQRDLKVNNELILGCLARTMQNEFYAQLDKDIAEYMSGGPVYTIKFEKKKASAPISVFGVECTETWTLTANLAKVADIPGDPYGRFKVSGRYEGDFKIDVKYDLTNFQAYLQSDIDKFFRGFRAAEGTSGGQYCGSDPRFVGRTMPYSPGISFSTRSHYISADYFVKPGVCDIEREMECKAVAEIDVMGGKSTMGLRWSMDIKRIGVRDIVLSETFDYSHYTGNYGIVNAEWNISADKDVFRIDRVYVSDVGSDLNLGNFNITTADFDPNDYWTRKWDTDMWESSDRVKDGDAVINLIPR